MLWKTKITGQTFNISRTLAGNNCIACRRCSSYIFILDLTTGFSGLGKDNCKTMKNIKVLLFGATYIRDLTVTFINQCYASWWHATVLTFLVYNISVSGLDG